MSITGVVTVDISADGGAGTDRDARAWLWEVAERVPFGESVELLVGSAQAPDADLPVQDPWLWLVAEHPLTVKGGRHVGEWVAFFRTLEARGVPHIAGETGGRSAKGTDQ